MDKSSRLPDFYKLNPEERLEIVKEFSQLSEKETQLIRKSGGLTLEKANKMVENTIGTQELPLGIATNFKINEKDRLIPMCTEEPSVIAAASNGAKMAREMGGFKTESSKPLMIGQIQVIELNNPKKAAKKIMAKEEKLLDLANEESSLEKKGGGAEKIETRIIGKGSNKMLIIHLIVDTRDAMGANVINTMVEKLGPYVEDITGGKTLLKIVSNLADKRISIAEAKFSKEELGGAKIVENIIKAQKFAENDPYRAATHNKGIMNGVQAVALATGNDTRAIEAAAHAFATKNGIYQPLTKWSKTEQGNLKGRIKIPTPLGTIGGATKKNPIAQTCLKILDTDSSQELGGIIAAVGLAQNLAALKALTTEGIQKGHMKLHNKK